MMKPFTILAIVVFILVSVIHYITLFSGLDCNGQQYNHTDVGSLLGFVVAGVLAIMLRREMKQTHCLQLQYS